MNLRTYIRKWGSDDLAQSQDGVLGLWGGVPGSPIMTDLESVVPAERYGGDQTDKTARIHIPTFVRTMNVANGENWTINETDILDSTLKFDARFGQIIKLSWNPRTGETLFIHPGNMHATVKGLAPFDDYVRVVVLRKQKLCTFRPFWPSWAPMKFQDADQAEFFDLSYSAQEACVKALKAHGATTWTFKYSVTNATLSEISGIGNW